MGNAKEYNMLFKLSAQLGKEFGTTFSSAQKTLNNTQKEINTLNKLQGDISSYQKQKQSIDSTTRKLSDLQREYNNIQREIQETGTFSSSLENKLIEKQRAIDKTSDSLQRQTEKLNTMENALRNAGINTGDLSKESQKLASQMDELAKEQAKAAEESQNFGEEGANAFDSVGNALIAAGVAKGLQELYEAFKECVSLAADFEETMSTVEALSGASSGDIARLSDMAKDLGATTKFTAKESADAMTYMAMAGWDAQQMMSGMDGVLQLAAAAGEDLAAVSDIVTDNLTAFGMKASDTAHFSDVLAAAATNSNTSVSVMGETFKNCAALAGALGYSVEDVAVAVGLMANAGIKGSNAGTALKNVFNGLLSGVTLTSEAFGEVEYSAINADGTMKSFGETINELRGYFEQMTGAEQMHNAEAIAGQRAMAGFVSIMNSTEADYASLTESINNCAGAAQKMAEIKMDNLNGQLTLMNSAADALKTTIGEQFAPELRGLAEIGTDILSGINQFAQEHPILIKSIIAITAEVGAFLAVYTAYKAVKGTMNTLRALSTVLHAAENAELAKETVNTGAAAAASGADAAAKTAEAAATTAAATAQTGLNAAMLASPIGWVLAGVSAVTVGLIALCESTKDEVAESQKLTASSQKQYDQLQALNREYKKACETYGETSYQAQELSWQIQDLNEQYEQSKQTIAEYREMVEDAQAAHAEMIAAHLEEQRELENEGASLLSLVGRLETLTKQSSTSAKSQQEVLAIVKALNAAVPDLSLSYNGLTGSLSLSTDAIQALIDAMLMVKKIDAYQDQIVAAREELELQKQIAEGAKKNREAAEEELTDLKARVDYMKSTMNSVDYIFDWNADTTLKKYAAQIGAQTLLIEQFAADEEEATRAIAENEAAIESLTNEMAEYNASLERSKASTRATKEYKDALLAIKMGYMDVATAAKRYGTDAAVLQEAKDEIDAYRESLEAALEAVENGYYNALEASETFGVSVGAIKVSGSLQETIDKINELGDAYHKTKDAAEQSIKGQYDLWDMAAVTISTDIGTINTALTKQGAYWEDYNTDLTALLARAGDVEGLGEVITSFADGSAESVNAIKGMADASEEELRAMVKNWREVQKWQQEAAGSIAELATGMGAEIDNLQSELERAVDVMNLDDEAAAAATATMEAYVQAIKDGTDNAVDEMERFSYLIATELMGKTIANFKFTGTGSTGAYYGVNTAALYAYASGTDNAARGLALVGELGPELVMFRGGEQVLPANETKALLRFNQDQSMINAYAEGTGGDWQILAMLPMFETLLEAMRDYQNVAQTAPVTAEYAPAQNVTITISPTFRVEGSAAEDLEDRLHGFVDVIVEEVQEAIREAGVDVRRGSYT